MNVFYCPHSGCSFFFETKHGIRTQCSRQHSTRARTHLSCQSAREPHLAIPRTLAGPGKRLQVDRVTQSLFGDSSTQDVNEPETEFEELIPPILLKSAELQATKDTYENVSKLMIEIKNRTSEMFCNGVLQILKKNLSVLQLFSSECRTYESILSHQKKYMTSQFTQKGFQQANMTTSDNRIKYELYWKDPIEVLRSQLRHTPSSELHLKPAATEALSHPMNAEIGKMAVPAAEKFIKESKDRNVFWKSRARHGIDSAIGSLQLYSDKSHMSLSAGSTVFYPLHITLLNFSEEWCRKHIQSDRTVYAYLPVHFEAVSKSSANEHKIDGEKRSKEAAISRISILKALHESIEFGLETVRKYALVGLECEILDRHRFLLHLMITSYIADILECEDLLAVKRGTKASSPCHFCMIQNGDSNTNKSVTTRSLDQSLNLLSDFRKSSAIAQQKLSEFSMLPVPPVLHDFPLIVIHESVDIYAIFRFEPLHCLSLGLSKLLKECLFNRLSDPNNSSSSMKLSSEKPKPFSLIKKIVLEQLNCFLKDSEQRNPGTRTRIDFSKGECRGKLSGFFTENGILGMQEAVNYEHVDFVSRFFNEIVDTLCGESRTAPVTQLFSTYADLDSCIRRRFSSPGWTESELSGLNSSINEFRFVAAKVFSPYQASNMGTSKRHFLSHLVTAIKEMGSIEPLDAGIYENSHKNFKSQYKKSSKKKTTAMAEAIQQGEYNRIYQLMGDRKKIEQFRNANSTKSVMENRPVLVGNSKTVTFSQLRDIQKYMRNIKQIKNVEFKVPQHAMQLYDAVDENGFATLLKLLHENIACKGCGASISPRKKIEIITLVYTNSYPTPTSDNPVYGESVYLEKTKRRRLQRIVASPSFYGANRRRLDVIMVENDEQNHENIPGNCIPVWFARALCFMRLQETATSCKATENHCSNSNDCDSLSDVREYCFVQYSEILSNSKLKTDRIDKFLNCLRLRWHRRSGREGHLSDAREFGLIPVDAIREKVQIVRRDISVSYLCKDDIRAQEYHQVSDGTLGWQNELIYVHWFHVDRSEEFDINELD